MMEANSNRMYSVNGRDNNSSNSSSYYAPRSEVPTGRKLVKTTGSLEIIEGSDSGMCQSSLESPANSRPPSNASSRPWSRGSVGSIPPRADSSMGRRVYTPTKQISLQAVRRKEESSEPFVDHIDWRSPALDTSHRKAWERAEDGGQGDAASVPFPTEHFRQDFEADPPQHTARLRLPIPNQTVEQKSAEELHSSDRVKTVHEVESKRDEESKDHDHNEEKDDDNDDDGDSDSSDDEEAEERKAPNELLMEFVDCLMKQDFQNASKLCKMILLYEPENPEALKFQPLIEEKMALDAEAAKEEEEENSDEDDDEDDSDDDDDSDDEDDDDETSSDEESSDTENEIGAGGDNGLNAQNNGRNVEFGHYPPHLHRADSGIASDAENGN